MAARRIPSVLILLMASMPAASAIATETTNAEALYLLPFDDITESYNFTTNSSRVAQAQVFPHLRSSTTSVWYWEMSRSPTNWSIDPGGKAAFLLQFRNLDQVIPAYGLPDEPDGVGSVQIKVGLISGSRDAFAQSVLYHRPSPTNDTTTRIEGTINVREAQEVTTEAIFGLRIEVYGQSLSDSAVEVVLGGPETPFLHVSGFPYDRFDSWEGSERAEKEKLENVLRRNAVASPTPSQTENETPPPQSTPAPTVLALLLLLGLIFARERRR